MALDIKEVIKKETACALKSLYGVDFVDFLVERPQNQKWGDYSTNVALVYAKKLGKTPMDMAWEVADFLQDGMSKDVFHSIEVANPGFVNFVLTKKFYLQNLIEILNLKDDFGKQDVGRGLKVALEHSNVNPNKAAHVGHLRNAVIGQFVERVYEFLNYDVNVQYYANDLGVQVSTSLLALKKFGSLDLERKYKKFDHYMWDLYAKVSSEIDKDPELKKELEDIVMALDSRDPVVSKEQKELSEKILMENLRSFASLGIDYDVIIYESSIKDMDMWDIAFNMIKNSRAVYKSESGRSKGCWLVRMTDDLGHSQFHQEIGVKNGSNDNDDNNDNNEQEDYIQEGNLSVEKDKIIVRSNGVPTYTGKDIAYHMWKFGLLNKDFRYTLLPQSIQDKPLYCTDVYGSEKVSFSNNDMVIDVIDVKQTYAIDAVRKAISSLGYKRQSDNLIHINYGHVYLDAREMSYYIPHDDRGRRQVAMSGRKGIGVKIDELIEMVENRLLSEHGNFPNFEEVRNAAIKFDMLRYDTFQDVVFSLSNALSIKGYSGTYIQYTHARASSVYEKSQDFFLERVLGSEEQDYEYIDMNKEEYELIKELSKFPDIVKESAFKFAPHLLCEYLYNLSHKYNNFYNKNTILCEEESIRKLRLLINFCVRQVLRNGMYLLGIKAVDRM